MNNNTGRGERTMAVTAQVSGSCGKVAARFNTHDLAYGLAMFVAICQGADVAAMDEAVGLSAANTGSCIRLLIDAADEYLPLALSAGEVSFYDVVTSQFQNAAAPVDEIPAEVAADLEEGRTTLRVAVPCVVDGEQGSVVLGRLPFARVLSQFFLENREEDLHALMRECGKSPQSSDDRALLGNSLLARALQLQVGAMEPGYGTLRDQVRYACNGYRN